MAAIFGMRDTGDWSTAEAPTAFSDRILYHYPDGPARFTMLLGRLAPKSVDSKKFTIFEQGLQLQRIKLGATQAEDVTTLTLDSSGDYAQGAYPGAFLRKGYVCMIESTQEVIVVDTNPAATATTISVVRDLNGAVADNDYSTTAADYLIVIGSAHPEGADVPRSLSENPDELFNYNQVFRTPMSLTGNAQEEYLRTGKPETAEKFKIGLEHSRSMELGFIFGQKASTTVDGETVRFTGGLNHWITSNVGSFATAGGISLTTWENFLEPIYSAPGGMDEKIAFCGSQAMVALNRLAMENSAMNVTPGDTTFGLKFKRYEHAHGSLQCMSHPLLSQNATFKSSIFIVDAKNVRRRFVKNRDTKFLKDRQSPGVDGITHEFLTDTGLELQHEATHGVAHGITAYIP